MGRFEGLTVLITGAAGGFGRRTAERLALGGAKLVLSDLDEPRLADLAASLACETEMLAGDVADERLSEELGKRAVSRFGRLDVAINNAGIPQSFVRLPQVPSDEARRILDVNLLGVFYAMRHQIPAMERQFRATRRGGAIVNIASAAGVGGAPKLSVYSAAKHGVVGLTRSAALEYASRGVRVNAVCPSYARTDMAQGFIAAVGMAEEEVLASLTRGVPMRRVAEVDEVVEAILFAADPKNSFMTGHTLSIDGGTAAM